MCRGQGSSRDRRRARCRAVKAASAGCLARRQGQRPTHRRPKAQGRARPGRRAAGARRPASRGGRILRARPSPGGARTEAAIPPAGGAGAGAGRGRSLRRPELAPFRLGVTSSNASAAPEDQARCYRPACRGQEAAPGTYLPPSPSAPVGICTNGVAPPSPTTSGSLPSHSFVFSHSM